LLPAASSRSAARPSNFTFLHVRPL
jgi:hypothetical protein